MPLSWNEIRDRAQLFAREWRHTENEDAEAKSFLDAFFDVFGVQRRKVGSFERRVKKLDGRDGYIDMLWKGTLLVEQKSRGKSLARAYQQAIDYFPGLSDDELPRYVVVSDFWRFELHDLDESKVHAFDLKDLPRKIHLFHFIAGYSKQRVRDEDPINQRAADAVGDLHDALKRDGYSGHRLEVFLVRLLFCLFADDTGIFQPKDIFADLIEFHTKVDGSDACPVLETLFATLNRPPQDRQRALANHYAVFPYVNGHLFEEHMDAPAFNAAMRKQLLALTSIRWGQISPAIRRHVPEGDGTRCQGAQARVGRALHQRSQHPAVDRSAVPRRVARRTCRLPAQPEQAVRVPQEAAGPDLPGPGMRLRQLSGGGLP